MQEFTRIIWSIHPTGISSAIVLFLEQYMKTHGSELRGQEEAACTSSGLRDHYSELFTQMATLKLENTVTQPP